MELKKYSEPLMEITEFDVYDVISTSADGDSTSSVPSLDKDDEEGFIEGWI